MTTPTRYERRLRELSKAADTALEGLQVHIAARDFGTTTHLSDVRDRLRALVPDLDDDLASGPRL